MPHSDKTAIVILGGDIAGPMAAAKLARYLPPSHYQITFVSPPSLKRAEFFAHVPPSIKRLHRDLKIKELDFIKAASATFSLGTDVVSEWRGFIPFGPVGPILNDTEFHHIIHRARPNGLYNLMLQARLAAERKFLLPQPSGMILLSGFDYGYHVDVSAYAKFLTEAAGRLGCGVIAGEVAGVTWEGEQISSAQLSTGEGVEGDIFIDCTGGDVASGTSKLSLAGHDIDWQSIHALPQFYKLQKTPHSEKAIRSSAYAKITASESTLEYQTQSRRVQLSLVSEQIEEALPYAPGWSPKPWSGNRISMGISAVSLPPASGLNLKLIDEQITRFIEFLPTHSGASALKAEYNRLCGERIHRAIEYTALLYHPREETLSDLAEAWPEAVYKYKYFKSRGSFAAMDQDDDMKDQWTALFLSRFGWPNDLNVMAQDDSLPDLIQTLSEMEKAIEQIVSSASSHREFIAAHCAAPDFVA